MILEHLSKAAREVGDYAATGLTVFSVLQWIPHLTAVIALIWWSLRVYESPTVQKLIRHLRQKKSGPSTLSED